MERVPSGEAGLSTGRINQIRAEAGLLPNVPVTEGRPQRILAHGQPIRELL